MGPRCSVWPASSRAPSPSAWTPTPAGWSGHPGSPPSLGPGRQKADCMLGLARVGAPLDPGSAGSVEGRMPTVLLSDPALAAFAGVLRAALPPEVELAGVTSFEDAELERLA